jgi:hypothetical protein
MVLKTGTAEEVILKTFHVCGGKNEYARINYQAS